MWELDYKESWALKKWCFWSVVLEKTLESPLDCKEIQPVHPKGNQSGIHWKDWCGSWNSNILATWWEALTLMKRPWCWQRMKAGGEGDDRGWDGWMALPIQWTWVWVTLGVGDGQGGLACCSPWGCKELDTTERLNWKFHYMSHSVTHSSVDGHLATSPTDLALHWPSLLGTIRCYHTVFPLLPTSHYRLKPVCHLSSWLQQKWKKTFSNQSTVMVNFMYQLDYGVPGHLVKHYSECV